MVKEGIFTMVTEAGRMNIWEPAALVTGSGVECHLSLLHLDM